MDALPQPPLAIGLGLIALSLVGALLLLARRRRRAADAIEPASDVETELVPETEDEPVAEIEADLDAEDAEPDRESDAEPDGEPDSGADAVAVRALRAQVRVLEQTLVVAAAAAAPEPAAGDLLASYRRQVRAAVHAVALGAGSDEARYAVARVAAALERLDAPDLFERPELPSATVGDADRPARVVVLASVPPIAPASPAPSSPALPAPALPAPALPASELAAPEIPVEVEPRIEPQVFAEASPRIEPQVVAEAETVAGAEVEAPVSFTVPETELVLPVPPPAPAETRRGRRRPRRRPAA